MVSCKTCPYEKICESENKSENFVAESCAEKDICEKEEMEWYEQMENERQAEINAMNEQYAVDNYDFEYGDGMY